MMARMSETNQPNTPQPTQDVDFDYITLDFEMSYVSADPGDPGQFSQPVLGHIFASCEEDEEGRVEIGYVKAIIVRIGQAMEAGFGPWTTLDAHSHETCECMELFEDQDFTATVQKMFYDACWIDDL